jgi:hypothetical protein
MAGRFMESLGEVSDQKGSNFNLAIIPPSRPQG